MIEQLLARLAEALDRGRIPYMVIGGQAVLVHGRPRLTQDIDLTLGVDTSQLKKVLDICRTIPLKVLPEDVTDFVQSTHVLPCVVPDVKIRVDFIFSFTPYEKQAISHSIAISLGGYDVHFATAEDLILHKLFAGRLRDREDIETILIRKKRELDLSYLTRWTKEFARIPGKESMLSDLTKLLDSK